MKSKFLVTCLAFCAKIAMAQTNTFPSDGYIGIGTLAPQEKLSLHGGHADTRIGLHFHHPDITKMADLLIWASEPGWTYTGVGIGNNISLTSGISRLNTHKGGSYIRLLDQEMTFNLLKLDGSDLQAMNIAANGNILIGKSAQQNISYKLDVNGKARVNELVVNTSGADFVFENNYKLWSLPELETFIKKNKHLPEIAPAKTMQTDGVGVGEMQTKLLQKIEELTLHLIEKDKQLSNQITLNKSYEQRLLKLEKIITDLKK